MHPLRVCAFICGVTEPFEFAFMFLAPVLYLIYALLYGIFTFITVLLGFRAGFSFSAGATDLLFSASLPAAQNTWMIIPLGIAGVPRVLCGIPLRDREAGSEDSRT